MELLIICYVDEDDIFMYIKNNEDAMNNLDDKHKIIRAIYEIWIEDKFFLTCVDIPEDSPHYGENWYNIENILPDDIRWLDDYYDNEEPSRILNKCRLRVECINAIKDTLRVDSCYVGIDIDGAFYVGIDHNLLYFDNVNFNFIDGNFYGRYRFKKNRPQIIREIQNAIYENLKIIEKYYNAHRIKNSIAKQINV